MGAFSSRLSAGRSPFPLLDMTTTGMAASLAALVRPCVARGFRRAGGKRSCINVSGLCLEHLLRTIMDIRARAVSLADRPRLGHLGHQCSHAPGRPNLHLYLSSRRPRQVRVIDLAMSSRIPHLTFLYSTIKQVERWRLTSPRSPDHGPG